MLPIRIKRTQCRLLRDARRVLAKPYLPGEETILPGESRAQMLMARVLAIPEDQVRQLNAELTRRFAQRHHDLHGIWEGHFSAVARSVPADVEVSADRRQLIGAYFTHEYSVEAAAL